MKKVTLFRKFTEVVRHTSIEECLDEIKNGTYQNEIENIRKINIEVGKEAADKLKKNLNAFTPSGVFESARKINSITEYNQCIILDLDDIGAAYIQSTKDNATLAPYTLAVFVSPRGTGLKIMVQVDSKIENHREAFLQVEAYYSQALNETIDPSGKDCSRLCFMSYDPDLYYNSDAEIFKVKLIAEKIILDKVEITEDEIFNQVVEFTNQKASYSVGNRNNYIHLLACNCNRKGLSLDYTLAKISVLYDLESAELTTSVKSAYEQNEAEFGKYKTNTKTAKTANFAKIAEVATFANDSEGEQQIDPLKSTPVIPDEVYNALPKLLKIGADAFLDDIRKRDVFLTSAITIMSGCLPNVTGIYHQERVYPNLFSFVIAPAANGKGVLKNAKRLADKYHNSMCEQSKLTMDEYESEMLKYKATCSKLKKDEEPPEKPVEPPFKRIFIPADSSQAMMIKMINDNDGKGIICETEADTMSGANKQDWGNYSPILRGAFHHEKVSVARKANNEVLEIPEPKMSVCLSGTPEQVPRLIRSAEDGLFSRFIFYAYRNDIIWRSPAPQPNGIVYNDHFDKLAEEVVEVVKLLENYPREVQLTESQWKKFNEEFSYLLQQSVLFNSDDIAGVVYRLGLITFRICMLFTALRKVENGDTSPLIKCSDEDFKSAVKLSKVYIEHSILMFNNLTDEAEEIKYKLPKNKQQLLNDLPEEFTRQEAVEQGIKLKMSTRTVDSLLQKITDILVEKTLLGVYKKILPKN